jgi:hypothetical protein
MRTINRVISLLLLAAILLPAARSVSFAADATSFDPTKVSVVAKSSGGVPVGTVVAWPVATNPPDMDKWLECNGQSISSTVYPELYALIGGTVPDYRGEFLRGHDAGRGVDAGRSLGSAQADQMMPITGWFAFGPGGANGGSDGAFRSTSYASGFPMIEWGIASNHAIEMDSALLGEAYDGSDTHPRNVAVRYLIRALP